MWQLFTQYITAPSNNWSRLKLTNHRIGIIWGRRSITNLFSIDNVNIYLLPIFLSIDFPGGKVRGYPTLLISWFKNLLSSISFLFKLFFWKVLYLLIRCYKTRFILWNTNITDRRGVNKQNTHTHTHTHTRNTQRKIRLERVSKYKNKRYPPTFFKQPLQFYLKENLNHHPFFQKFQKLNPTSPPPPTYRLQIYRFWAKKTHKKTFFLASSFHIFALNRFAMLHIFYEQLTPPSAILLFCRWLMKYY